MPLFILNMIIFSRNPTGVAVQLVKWYQYMAVCWQLNDCHLYQIFKAVLLDSYEIFDLLSAVLQPQVITYSRLQYFSKLSLNRHDFRRNIFFVTKCVLIFFLQIFSEIFLITRKVERKLITKYQQFFISKSRFSCQIHTKFEFFRRV